MKAGITLHNCTPISSNPEAELRSKLRAAISSQETGDQVAPSFRFGGNSGAEARFLCDKRAPVLGYMPHIEDRVCISGTVQSSSTSLVTRGMFEQKRCYTRSYSARRCAFLSGLTIR